ANYSTSPLPYQWAVTRPDGATQILYGSPATVTFLMAGTYTIELGYSSCWPTSGASVTFTATSLYSLYPNPVTTGILKIVMDKGSSLSHTCLAYTIRSVATGAIVLQGQVNTSLTILSQINVSSLSTGLYLVQLATCGTLLQPSTLIQTDVIVIP
ncbi:MAG: T9SS type A sorting domain-containing protein, partial [Prevotellaceae bacterium]|nr:T9SS type A sorting domain-containing protein [Prevotellaceae bacterium]